jgi:signal transduction histidine kinase
MRAIRWLALVTAIALAWLEWQASPNANPSVLALDIVVGLIFAAAGIIVLGVAIARRVAYLQLAAGAAWFAGALIPLASSLYLGFLVHLLATYPTGRLAGRVERTLVASGYGVALGLPYLGVGGVDAGLVAAVAVASQVRGAAAGGPLRRGRMGAAVGAATIALTLALVQAGLAGGTLDVVTARTVTAIVLILTIGALAIDLRWGGWSPDALARLVIDLGDHAPATTLRDRLAEALDDPTLVIGYRLGDGETYVDDDGRRVELPAPGSARIAVPLNAAGVEVGVLVRDERWPVDPTLADGVAAAAELALGNARLHAATRRQVEDLEASRARLIASAESERDRIRHELDDGALRRLARVRDGLEATAALGPDRASLREQAGSVMRQLEELSGGLGPVSDLEHGLGPALQRLAAVSPVAAVADISVGSLPPLVEATAYFVCSEGLANVAKHAGASRVTLSAREVAGWLLVEVDDDGVGGASASSGSGLDGIRQRVESTGGRLTIEDRGEGGTRLLAELPLDRRGGRVVIDPPGRTA